MRVLIGPGAMTFTCTTVRGQLESAAWRATLITAALLAA
jgi:hypothetical protein